MTTSSQEIYQRYVWASAITSNADAVAEMFTADGVIEAPLLAADKLFPQRVQGREEIRGKLAAYYEQSGDPGRTVNAQASRYVLHETTRTLSIPNFAPHWLKSVSATLLARQQAPQA